MTLFFPDLQRGGEHQSIAKSVCAACSVREECLEYALDTNQQWGIWGGLLPRERRRIRRSA